MKKTIAFTSVAMLAACLETPLPSDVGEFVSFSQAIAENAGRPYECVEHDAATNSCSVIAQYRTVSGGIRADSSFILNAEPLIELSVGGIFVERNGALCAVNNTLDVEIDGIDDSFARELAIATIENEFEKARLAGSCTSFYRRGDGYISVTRDSTGKELNEGEYSVSTFIARQPRLRYEEH